MPADGLQPDKTFHVTIRTWFDQTDGLGILHHSHYVLMMERAQKIMFIALMGKDTTLAPDRISPIPLPHARRRTPAR